MRSDMPRHLVLLLALFFAWTAWPHAQTQVIVNGLRSAITNVDLETGRTNWQMPCLDPTLFTCLGDEHMAVSGDGRWALWAASQRNAAAWLLRDLVTGNLASGRAAAPFTEVLAHPRRLQLFATQFSRGSVLIIDPSGAREVRVCGAAGDTAISLNGALLFFSCSNEIVVFDTAREQVVGRMPLPPALRSLEVLADSSRLFVLSEREPGEPGYSLTVYDWPTHAVIARLPMPPQPSTRFLQQPIKSFLTANADRGEVYLSLNYWNDAFNHEGQTWVYSGEDFRVIGIIRQFISAAAFTPDGRTVVALAENPFPQKCSALLIDARTWTSRAAFFDNKIIGGG
jgi:hypothetical protein